MDKRYGFTLIEMLGVFTVLAIIMLISLPAITKNLKKNEVNKYDAFVKDVELATETYIETHRDSYTALNNVGGSVTITIGTLKSENLITDVPKKPNGTTISDSATIKVTANSDKTFTYQFQG